MTRSRGRVAFLPLVLSASRCRGRRPGPMSARGSGLHRVTVTAELRAHYLIEIFSQDGAYRLRQHRHMSVTRMIETRNYLRPGGPEPGYPVTSEGKPHELDR